MQLFNTTRFNEGLLVTNNDTASSDVSVTYSLRVFDKDGFCLAYLPLWSNGSITGEINNSGTIAFDYPAQDMNAAHLHFPNQIWLYNQNSSLINKYHIMPVDISSSQGSSVVTVKGESLLYQLSKELIISYTTEVVQEDPEEEVEETKPVIQILKDWFALQTHSSKLFIGKIDAAIASEQISITLDKGTILDGINQLFEAVNLGQYWVDPVTRKFNWRLRRGFDKGQQIRLGKNMNGITISADYSQIVNRLYLYGNDNGENGQVTLLDAGHDEEYLDHSSSISTYGVQAAVKILKDVQSPDLLMKYAETFLDMHAQPRLAYEVDFVNLHASDPIRYAFEGMAFGSDVWVLNEDLNVSTKLTILKMEHSLDNPLQMKLTLGNKPVDLEMVFAQIAKRIATLEKQTNLVMDKIKENLIADGFLNTSNVGTELLDIATNTEDPQYDDLYQAIDELVDDYLADPLSNLATEFAGLDGLNEEAVQDLIDNAIDSLDIPGPATDPPSPIVSSSPSVGDGTLYALANHDHLGMPWKTATSKAALDEILEDGEIGYVTSGSKRGYMKVDGETLCITHLEASPPPEE